MALFYLGKGEIRTEPKELSPAVAAFLKFMEAEKIGPEAEKVKVIPEWAIEKAAKDIMAHSSMESFTYYLWKRYARIGDVAFGEESNYRYEFSNRGEADQKFLGIIMEGAPDRLAEAMYYAVERHKGWGNLSEQLTYFKEEKSVHFLRRAIYYGHEKYSYVTADHGFPRMFARLIKVNPALAEKTLRESTPEERGWVLEGLYDLHSYRQERGRQLDRNSAGPEEIDRFIQSGVLADPSQTVVRLFLDGDLTVSKKHRKLCDYFSQTELDDRGVPHERDRPAPGELSLSKNPFYRHYVAGFIEPLVFGTGALGLPFTGLAWGLGLLDGRFSWALTAVFILVVLLGLWINKGLHVKLHREMGKAADRRTQVNQLRKVFGTSFIYAYVALGLLRLVDISPAAHWWLALAIASAVLVGAHYVNDWAAQTADFTDPRAPPRPILQRMARRLVNFFDSPFFLWADLGKAELSLLPDSSGPLYLGASDISPYENGAFTGQVSRQMLEDAGAHYVRIPEPRIGNSDLSGEDNRDVALKIQQALSSSGAAPALQVVVDVNLPSVILGDDFMKRELTRVLREKLLFFKTHPAQIPRLALALHSAELFALDPSLVKNLPAMVREIVRDEIAHAQEVKILIGGKTGDLLKHLPTLAPSIDGVVVHRGSIEKVGDVFDVIERADSVKSNGDRFLVVVEPWSYGAQAEKDAWAIKESLGTKKNVAVVLLSSDFDLRRLGQVVSGGRWYDVTPQEKPTNIYFALQDLEDESPRYLEAIKEAGITHVLLGHSEVRRYRGVTDEVVARQAKAVADHGLVPILAVGEKDRLHGNWKKGLLHQTKTVCSSLSPEQLKKTILAYEPLAFIGGGQEMSTAEMAEASEVIVKAVKVPVKIIYGGSEKPSSSYEHGGGWALNTHLRELRRMRHYQGALIGTRSVIPGDPERIAERFAEQSLAKGKSLRGETGGNWKMNVHYLQDAERRIDGFLKTLEKNKWAGNFFLVVPAPLAEPLIRKYRGRHAPLGIQSLEWTGRQRAINQAIDRFWTWWEDHGQDTTIESLEAALSYFLHHVYRRNIRLRFWDVSWFRLFRQAILSPLFSDENVIQASTLLANLRYAPLQSQVADVKQKDPELGDALESIVGGKDAFLDLSEKDVGRLRELLITHFSLTPYEQEIFRFVIPPEKRGPRTRNELGDVSIFRLGALSQRSDLMEAAGKISQGEVAEGAWQLIEEFVASIIPNLQRLSNAEIDQAVAQAFASAGVKLFQEVQLLDRLRDAIDFDDKEREQLLDQVNFARIWGGIRAHLSRSLKLTRDAQSGGLSPAPGVPAPQSKAALREIGKNPASDSYRVQLIEPVTLAVDVSALFEGRSHSLWTTANYLIRKSLGDKEAHGFDPNTRLAVIYGIEDDRQLRKLVDYVEANPHHGRPPFELHVIQNFEGGAALLAAKDDLGREEKIEVRSGGYRTNAIKEGVSDVIVITSADPDAFRAPKTSYQVRCVNPDLDPLLRERDGLSAHPTSLTRSLEPLFEHLEKEFGIANYEFRYVTPGASHNLRPLDQEAGRGLTWKGRTLKKDTPLGQPHWEARAHTGAGFAQLTFTFNRKLDKEELIKSLHYASLQGFPFRYGGGTPNGELVELQNSPLVIDSAISVMGSGKMVTLQVWIPNWAQAQGVIEDVQADAVEREKVVHGKNYRRLLSERKAQIESANRAGATPPGPRSEPKMVGIFGGDEVVAGEMLRQLREDRSVIVKSVSIEETTENPLDVDSYIVYLRQLMPGAQIDRGTAGDTVIINGSSPIRVHFDKKGKVPNWEKEGADTVVVADRYSTADEATFRKHQERGAKAVLFALDPGRPVQSAVALVQKIIGEKNPVEGLLAHTNAAIDPYRDRIHDVVDAKRAPAPFANLIPDVSKEGVQIQSGLYDSHLTFVTLQLSRPMDRDGFIEVFRKAAAGSHRGRLTVVDDLDSFRPSRFVERSGIFFCADPHAVIVHGRTVTCLVGYDFARVWAAELIEAIKNPIPVAVSQRPAAPAAPSLPLFQPHINLQMDTLPVAGLKEIPLAKDQKAPVRLAIDLSEVPSDPLERNPLDYLAGSFVYQLMGDRRASPAFYGVRDALSFYRSVVKRLPKHVSINLDGFEEGDYNRYERQLSERGFTSLTIESEGKRVTIPLYKDPLSADRVKEHSIESIVILSGKNLSPRSSRKLKLSRQLRDFDPWNIHVLHPVEDAYHSLVFRTLHRRLQGNLEPLSLRTISSLPTRSSEPRLRAEPSHVWVDTPARLEGQLHNLVIEFKKDVEKEELLSLLQALKDEWGDRVEITDKAIASLDVVNNPKEFVLSTSQISGHGRLWSLLFWTGESGLAKATIEDAIDKALQSQKGHAEETRRDSPTLPAMRPWLPKASLPPLVAKGRKAGLVFSAALGRSGKQMLWQAMGDPNVDILGITLNKPTAEKVMASAEALNNDSVYGDAGIRFVYGGCLDPKRKIFLIWAGSDTAGWKRLVVYDGSSPKGIPEDHINEWRRKRYEPIYLDVTGRGYHRFKEKQWLEKRFSAVVFGNPGKGENYLFFPGVSSPDDLASKVLMWFEQIFGLGSCTSNAVAVPVFVLKDFIDLFAGITFHEATNDQRLNLGPLHDVPERTLRSAGGMIFSSSGAGTTIGKVIREVAGRSVYVSLREGFGGASVATLVIKLKEGLEVSAEKIKEILRNAAESPRLKGILAVHEKPYPLDAEEVKANLASSVVDLNSVRVQGDRLGFSAWNDNEAYFSRRMVDLGSQVAIAKYEEFDHLMADYVLRLKFILQKLRSPEMEENFRAVQEDVAKVDPDQAGGLGLNLTSLINKIEAHLNSHELVKRMQFHDIVEWLKSIKRAVKHYESPQTFSHVAHIIETIDVVLQEVEELKKNGTPVELGHSSADPAHLRLAQVGAGTKWNIALRWFLFVLGVTPLHEWAHKVGGERYKQRVITPPGYLFNGEIYGIHGPPLLWGPAANLLVLPVVAAIFFLAHLIFQFPIFSIPSTIAISLPALVGSVHFVAGLIEVFSPQGDIAKYRGAGVRSPVSGNLLQAGKQVLDTGDLTPSSSSDEDMDGFIYVDHGGADSPPIAERLVQTPAVRTLTIPLGRKYTARGRKNAERVYRRIWVELMMGEMPFSLGDSIEIKLEKMREPHQPIRARLFTNGGSSLVPIGEGAFTVDNKTVKFEFSGEEAEADHVISKIDEFLRAYDFVAKDAKPDRMMDDDAALPLITKSLAVLERNSSVLSPEEWALLAAWVAGRPVSLGVANGKAVVPMDAGFKKELVSHLEAILRNPMPDSKKAEFISKSILAAARATEDPGRVSPTRARVQSLLHDAQKHGATAYIHFVVGGAVMPAAQQGIGEALEELEAREGEGAEGVVLVTATDEESFRQVSGLEDKRLVVRLAQRGPEGDFVDGKNGKVLSLTGALINTARKASPASKGLVLRQLSDGYRDENFWKRVKIAHMLSAPDNLTLAPPSWLGLTAHVETIIQRQSLILFLINQISVRLDPHDLLGPTLKRAVLALQNA